MHSYQTGSADRGYRAAHGGRPTQLALTPLWYGPLYKVVFSLGDFKVESGVRKVLEGSVFISCSTKLGPGTVADGPGTRNVYNAPKISPLPKSKAIS